MASKKPSRKVVRALRTCVFTALGVTGLGAMGGCLDRPIAPATPKTSNVLTDKVSLSSVDKIDLLFMIDNSSSMADKQEILANVVGDLVNRLINPNCVVPDAMGHPMVVGQSMNGSCPQGKLEFNPINDIHIGVVSSSLGDHGAGDACTFHPDQPLSEGNNSSLDDQGHLIARAPVHPDPDPTKVIVHDPTTFAFAKATTYQPDEAFLAWDPKGTQMPPGEANSANLINNFQSIVYGTDQIGCGYESSLEGWYRFLIDPNPPANVAVPTGGNAGNLQPAVLKGTDQVLLQQRAEFLRPDSLVAVVLISDENDFSVIDGIIPPKVQAADGLQQDWPANYGVDANFVAPGSPFPANYFPLKQTSDPSVANSPPFQILPGTAACQDDPYSPDCKSCYLAKTDPACKSYMPPMAGTGLDNSNLREWNAKQRFGVDIYYPLQRYVDGLHATQIYDMRGLPVDQVPTIASLVNNPLYDDLPFQRLQDLSKLLSSGKITQAQYDQWSMSLKKILATSAGGTRSKMSQRPSDLVFFAAITGVPWQDIAIDPTDLSKGYRTASASSPALAIDWDLILGDPFNHDKTARKMPKDPLMRETIDDRTKIAGISTKLATSGETLGSPGTWNSINGHDWNTLGADLQYACVFPLKTPRNCQDPKYGQSCDCGVDPINAMNATYQDQFANPLCEVPADMANPTKGGTGKYGLVQYRAKAYPGTRYLKVLHDFGKNAIAASICPANTTDPAKADYGYRPAVGAIIDQLKTQLGQRCLPRTLIPNPDGSTPCVIMSAQFPKSTNGASSGVDANTLASCKQCNAPGLKPLDPDIAKNLQGEALNYECVCQLNQLEGADLKTCQTNPSATVSSVSTPGWCYVEPPPGADPNTDPRAQIVAKCSPNEKRTIQFLTPTSNSTYLLTCLGAPTVSEPTTTGGGGSAATTGGQSAGGGGP